MEFKIPSEDKYSESLQSIKDLLRTLVPKATVSVGSVLYEWIIRPLSMSSASVQESLEELSTTKTLKYLSTSTNTEEGDADAILSNYFVTRRSGTASSGLVTITSSTRETTIPANTMFSAGNTTLTTEYSVCGVTDPESRTATGSIVYTKAIKTEEGYVFNVPVTAQSDVPVVIPEGTAVDAASYIDGFVSAVVGSAVFGGETSETDADMVKRASTAVASPIGGTKAIQKLLEASGYPVYSSASFGQQDPEMLRDEYNAVLIGTGGMVDTYVKTDKYPRHGTTTVNLTGSGIEFSKDITEDLPKGFISITSVTLPEGVYGSFSVDFGSSASSAKAVSGDIPIDSPQGARFSAYQTAKMTLVLDAVYSADTLQVGITYSYMPYIQELQDYMNRPDVRMVGVDVRIKAALPATITLQADGVYVDTTPEDVSQIVQEFINSSDVGISELNLADLQEVISNNLPGTYLKNPIQTMVSTPNYNGRTYSSAESDNGLVVVNVEDKYTTERMRFFCIGTTEITLR